MVSGVTVISAVLLWLVGPAGWQAPSTTGAAPTISQDVLESIVQLECAFTERAAGTWSDAAPPSAQISTLSIPLAVSLLKIDVAGGSATSESAGRRWAVSVRSDRSNLYFLDSGVDGVSRLTTVFSQQTVTGRLKAVHTRTGRSAEQFYGDCAIRP